MFDRLNKFADKIADKIAEFFIEDSEPISFNDYISKMSKKIDKIILKNEKEKNLKFIGGNCDIEYSESDKKEEIILSNIKLYYQDSEKSFIEEKIKNEMPVKNFTYESQQKEIKDIREGKRPSFSIEHPNKNN